MDTLLEKDERNYRIDPIMFYIIENIENFPQLKSSIGSTYKEEAKHYGDIQIYEKLSPGDVYIPRIVNGELETIQNHGGNIIYKRDIMLEDIEQINRIVYIDFYLRD
jgi:hypothetical protein